jgi:hypothetical protein
MTEKRDEDQILSQMRGEVLSTYVYSFTQGNRTITSLSYAGVKEAIRRRGNIAFHPCSCCHRDIHVEETPEEVRASVTVWDLQNNVRFLGASSARKNQPFAFTLAVNKAERNALRKLLPEKQIALIVEQFLRKDSPKPVSEWKEDKTILPKVGLGPQRLDH